MSTIPATPSTAVHHVSAASGPVALDWGNDRFTLTIMSSPDRPPSWARLQMPGEDPIIFPEGLGLADVVTVSEGHEPATDRLLHSALASGFRLASHRTGSDSGTIWLALDLRHEGAGIELVVHLCTTSGLQSLKSEVVVRNTGTVPQIIRAIPSWCSYLGAPDGIAPAAAHWKLHYGVSDWLGEGRFNTEDLGHLYLPPVSAHLTEQNPRSTHSFTSTGTWSTARNLPVAVAEAKTFPFAWAWQIEHNGPWRWELGEDNADAYLALSGPTDLDHQFIAVLQPGESFRSVPVSVAWGRNHEGAIAALTQYRRAFRRSHPDTDNPALVFNDYMNTLNGDPTTEKLLPLVEAAAQAGADTFVIDAGWYDDSGDWWDSVGQWKPSKTRFPNGLKEVTDRITELGMTPGLWLEPEVVGVKSPMADLLPSGAFLERHGQRIVEHGRYHLDFRHPATVAHLDGVVERLITEFGIGFFKLDYNINPGPGTDVATASIGGALLEHSRAHLTWLDSILDRYPSLVLENCGSGAMRMDYAMLSRLQMQSTSDQQDFTRYPAIAASAPMSMVPEQAASWAYPQPDMDREDIAFCMNNAMLGRLYLSGYLNKMTTEELELVKEGVSVHKSLSGEIASSTAFWPMGLPRWNSPWIVLGLQAEKTSLLTVWSSDVGAEDRVDIDLENFADQSIHLECLYPTQLKPWESDWNPATAVLSLRNTTGARSSRTFRITTD